jgi:hypothetical protein
VYHYFVSYCKLHDCIVHCPISARELPALFAPASHYQVVKLILGFPLLNVEEQLVHVLKPLRTARFARFSTIYFQASQTSTTTPHKLFFPSSQQIGNINGNALFESSTLPRFSCVDYSSSPIVFPAAILLVFTTCPVLGKKILAVIRKK